jgi:IclR family transcriptional regulator, acetate operon repressor
MAAAPTGTQAVDRAATLLVEVLKSEQSVTFGDLTASSRLPKSTVSRLLTSLERHGLVRRGSDASIHPGPVLTHYAESRRTDLLLRVAQPHLNRLGDLTGETINLGVISGQGVEQITQVDSRFMLGAVNWVGREVPLHSSALGKVLMAFGTAPLPIGRLERHTDKTITSRADLEADLRSVRRNGYAVADSELEPGLVAIAAPVVEPSGTVVAAVSVTGPSVRLTGERIPRVARLLVTESKAISRALDPKERPKTRRVGVA